MIPALVYLLCAITSGSCALLLLRQYQKSRAKLVLWSGLCFVGLALNNALLFTDLVLVPTLDLSAIRTLPALAGLAVLIWGFIWDSA